MKRNIVIILLVILLQASVNAPFCVFAVSYPPAPLYHRDTGEPVRVIGQKLYLFHSGTEEVKKTIHISDILAVFRIDTSCKVKEVGKIKIISYIGENYLTAVVIEGEIEPDDIARKGNVSCLVISVGMCNLLQ